MVAFHIHSSKMRSKDIDAATLKSAARLNWNGTFWRIQPCHDYSDGNSRCDHLLSHLHHARTQKATDLLKTHRILPKTQPR
jgi:hypothetical protein